MAKSIAKYGDPVLTEPTIPVNFEIDTPSRLAMQLIKAMYTADGVGLAAPQYGVPVKMFVYDLRMNNQPTVVINPQIVSYSSWRKQMWEGCLSLPDINVAIQRSHQVECHYQDLYGEQKIMRVSGFEAQIFQHEVDHLNGILFCDYWSEEQWEEVQNNYPFMGKLPIKS